MRLRIRPSWFFSLALIAVAARAETGATANPAAAGRRNRPARHPGFRRARRVREGKRGLPATPANRVVFLGDSIAEDSGQGVRVFSGRAVPEPWHSGSNDGADADSFPPGCDRYSSPPP